MERIRESILTEMRLAEVAGRRIRVVDVSESLPKVTYVDGTVCLHFSITLKPVTDSTPRPDLDPES